MAEGNIGEAKVAPAIEAPEPGGWLAQYQRAHCTGASPLRTYQGLLVDEIVLPESAAVHANPIQLVLACNAWVEALQNQALFIAGEFAPEALFGFYAHDYITQAKAGGHAQYFAARGGDDLALRCAQAGLKSMLADPHLEIFNTMIRLRRGNRKSVRKLMREKRYRNMAAAWRDLDKSLAELEAQEPLAPRHKTWLKSLRKLKLAPDAEMSQHLNRVAGANRLYQHRRQEAAHLREAHEAGDPAYKAARALCEMAGLKIAGLHAGVFAPMRDSWPEGPDRGGFAIRVDTDRGPRAALFYVEGGFFKKRLAVLIEHGNPLPVGSLTLSGPEYDQIVPAACG
ncbi:MAG TPA: hypothetical protein VEF55_03550 [Candidatus Binatia bacterium]|nr:hypothetical protein [Candidatus Binatia bacterium]